MTSWAHSAIVPTGVSCAPIDGPWCLSSDETMLVRYWQGKVVVTRVSDGAEVTAIPVATAPLCLSLQASVRRLAIAGGQRLRSGVEPSSGDGLRLVGLDTLASETRFVGQYSLLLFFAGRFVDRDDHRKSRASNLERGGWQPQVGRPIYETLEQKRPELNLPEYCGFTDDSRHVITVFRRHHQGVKMWTLEGEQLDVADLDTFSPTILAAAPLDDHSIVLAGRKACIGFAWMNRHRAANCQRSCPIAIACGSLP